MTLYEKIKYLPGYILGYNMGDPERNGEYRFLDRFVKNDMTVFDVGANVGEYSEYLVNKFEYIKLHSFEPVEENFLECSKKLQKLVTGSKIVINPFGLSDKKEERSIYKYGKFAGTDSLYLRNSDKRFEIESVEKIQLETLDSYVQNNLINKIHLLKIDVEGHELKVLQGATYTLEKGKILCIQFEFGATWKDANATIDEAVILLSRFNYILYRLTPWGKLIVNTKKIDNRDYRYCNYIAIKRR